ncbi:MAG: SecD/SecF fusion protein, partial [Planctomycetota bacterium]
MFENVGRKITLILSLLAIAVVALIVGQLRLGLDLEGGTRMEYRLPYQDALDEGTITAQEFADKPALTRQIVTIFRNRVDPSGVRDPQIYPVGDDRIVIELPGNDSGAHENIVGVLDQELPKNVSTLTLQQNAEVIADFPSSGGTIQIGSEKIYYIKREGTVLRNLKRGYAETPEEVHIAGTEVRLINADPWRTLIENVGNLQFFIEAEQADLQGSDLQTERTRATSWSTTNSDTSLDAYNRLPYNGTDTGGPAPRLKWYAMPDDGTPRESRMRGLIISDNENWRFSGEALKQVSLSRDDFGYPAVGFEMATTRKTDFTDFTTKHTHKPMAIVINGEIVTMPTINGTLPGGGIINGGAGGFKLDEVNDLITVLRSGSLKIKPILEHQERVGATLGRDYVRRGAFSVILGLVSVLLFVVFYYKRLGVFAAVSLLANLLLLMGVMAFLQATLTLPGVAGIILTVGMAVDANILIYERIREETLRGRKPFQAAQDGFKHAFSTIVDANLTTLITGLILLYFGSGPVAGFATTLCWGIITSMFSALVITKVLVHLQLEKGVDSFNMVRWIADTSIDFMGKTKLTTMISTGVIVFGVGLFISMPAKEKLGIDFLGGVTMTVRMQEPQSVETIRTRVSAIGGTIGESSEVKEILASENGDNIYNQFRITFKTPSAEEFVGGDDIQSKEGLKDTVESEIQEKLKDLLEKGPFEVTVGAAGATTGAVYFNEVHPEDAITTKLGEVGLSDVSLNRIIGPTAAWSFTGTATLDKTKAVLGNEIVAAFSDKPNGAGGTFEFARSIPSSSVVGAQVVAELRDNAIFAILLSLFAAVMYIRVRFAEYSYGLAAVCALVHDVLVTLGALAVAQKSGLIEAEINLPMIAAFLTIIGYSLNDTIVVFDRVRENLPRMKGSMSDIINRSLNQTLARTVLTSVTTLITVVILLVFNLGSRNVLEGFAFALMTGVLVGTYSSMFIASPVLFKLETKRQAAAAAA